MASTINGTSTGNGGLITTGDDSGILNIQTNETTAVSVDASQNLTFTNGINAPNTFGFKNRVINGNMAIDQRNVGASVTVTDSLATYITDRWQVFENGSMSFTAQQSSTVPNNFSKSLLVTSTAAVTPGAASRSALTQIIEGYNIADLGWGTASAASVTLSFWVRSSLTGQFGGSLQNAAQDYSYPFTFTINSANTFEYKTITIAGPTTGTWNSDNTGGVRLAFDLGMGSDLLGTSGAWTAADKRGATGDTRINGTNGATFYITGVQLEKGTQATSFDFRDYGRELIMCQRYCFRLNAGGARIGVGTWGTSTSADIQYMLPVEMRTTPSITGTASGALLNYGIAWYTVTSGPTLAESSNKMVMFTLTASAATSTQGKGATWGNGSIGDPNAYLSAEL